MTRPTKPSASLPRLAQMALMTLTVWPMGCAPGHLEEIGWHRDAGGYQQAQSLPTAENGGAGGSSAPYVPAAGLTGTGGNRAAGGNSGSAGSPGTYQGGSTGQNPAPDAGRPDTLGAPTDTLASAPTPACATAEEVSAKILVPKCGACHGKNAPAAGLDLVTAGAKMRLLAAPSKGCTGKSMVVAGPPVTGHFFDKLIGSVPNCGGQMPFGAPPLDAIEVKCLKDWINPTP